jgi:C_GCAxxG_C_C family probable redox protein
MSQEKELGEKAAAYFLKGYCCAQAVLLTMTEHWNIESELVPKIATGFGGGIGRCGSVCGALTGAVMAIGVRDGTNEPSGEKRLKAYEKARKLYEKFKKQHGSVLCRDLIGYDLSNPEGSAAARKARVFEERCPVFVKTAVEVLLELTDEH